MEKLIQLKKVGTEENGYLSVFDDNTDLGFPIKRIYYTYGVTKDGVRGNHAHKTLKQVLWCPYGSIHITVDNGSSQNIYTMDSPDKALVVPGGLWLSLCWEKEDSVLCVAASDYFYEEDYIRDYTEYLAYAKKEV